MGFWGREGLRLRLDHKLGLAALESEGGSWREKEKSKDGSTPSGRRRHNQTSPVATRGASVAIEAGAPFSSAPLATCFLGIHLFLPKAKPLGKEAGGGSGHQCRNGD